MADEQPELLTPKGITLEVIRSLIIVGGWSLIEYLRKRVPELPSVVSVVLLLLDLVILIYSLALLVQALGYLWDKFSILVERVAVSPTWPRLKSAALKIVQAAVKTVKFVAVFVMGLVVLDILRLVLNAAFPDLMARLFPVAEFTASTRPDIGKYILYAILITLVMTLCIRVITYFTQVPRTLETA
jgi:hypothetical protein